ncbi:hypothetical protein PHLCEN_2v12160 [Hermanssonia centrifuga]|uniref:Uncharacterized protein n=1 Tax=Hermanssonia centrifuga TaxID=98765 RepID=A0A2R6NHV7_9APHY|nr:hypothetical protein PHLCEN_2v12160 [Hermanssonia centrifuga]
MVNAYTQKDIKEEREVEEMLEPPCNLPFDGPCRPTMHRTIVDYVMDEEQVHEMLCEKTNLLSDEITSVGDMETSESNPAENNRIPLDTHRLGQNHASSSPSKRSRRRKIPRPNGGFGINYGLKEMLNWPQPRYVKLLTVARNLSNKFLDGTRPFNQQNATRVQYAVREGAQILPELAGYEYHWPMADALAVYVNNAWYHRRVVNRQQVDCSPLASSSGSSTLRNSSTDTSDLHADGSQTARFSSVSPHVSISPPSSGNLSRRGRRLVPQPIGTPGLPGRAGYNLKTTLKWGNEEYDELWDLVRSLVKEHHLDESKPISLQAPRRIEAVIKGCLEEMPRLKWYENCWPVRDVIARLLKKTSYKSD